MAVTISHDLTEIWNGEDSLSWSGDTPTLFTTFYREGTGCYGWQVSSETVDSYTTVSSFDMSNAAIYIWFALYGQMDTYANGGVGIILGDGTNRVAYYTGGKDYTPFSVIGWQCHMVDAQNPPTNYSVLAGSESSLDFSAITQVGVHFKTLQKSLGGAENCFADVARWGTGITIKGGTSGDPATFDGAAADDASTSAGKAYGIIREIAPGVYGVQGRLDIGDDGTGDSYFYDKDSVVVFEDTGAGDSLYTITGKGNSTGTNVIKFGDKVGTGDEAVGAKGVTIQSSGPAVTIDFTDSNLDTVDAYGSKFFKITGDLKLGPDSNAEFIGCTFDQSTQVEVNSVQLRNDTFSGTVSTSGAILWNESINIKNCRFSGNTTGSAIEHPSSTGSPYTHDNLVMSGNTYDVNNSSGSSITINLSNGSNASTYTGSSVTFVSNPVTTKIIVKDITNGDAISGARVLLWATDNSNYFYQTSVSITGSGTTATVSHTGHGLSTGDNVIIEGANEDMYNGAYSVTVSDANTYTYTMSESASASPATGTITSTFAFINGTTDSSGEISDTRSLSSNQPVYGWVRQATTQPYYQQGVISGTVDASNGFTTTIQLVRDE